MPGAGGSAPPPIPARMAPADALDQLRASFRANGDPGRSADMRRYMRDLFPYHGVDAPNRRRLQAPVVAASADWSAAELLEFADLAWAEPEREPAYTASDVLRRRVGRLGAAELPRVRRLIQTDSWWDTVDLLSAHVVGPMVLADASLAPVMDDWIISGELWLARAGVLHQLGYRDRTDASRLFAQVDALADHPDFFIRKALGWALRTYARVDPDAVWAFVDARADRLSPLTVREATKHR